MKTYLLFFLLFLLPFTMMGQDSEKTNEQTSIVEMINRPESGKGFVTIIQEESIAERIGKPGNGVLSEDTERYVEMSGYRIQVFVGNNQRVSKNEAYSKESEIKSIFPELSTYVAFSAPFWKLKVGDFQTYQTAQQTLLKLRSKFPSYGREMSVIKDKVRIKVQ